MSRKSSTIIDRFPVSYCYIIGHAQTIHCRWYNDSIDLKKTRSGYFSTNWSKRLFVVSYLSLLLLIYYVIVVTVPTIIIARWCAFVWTTHELICTRSKTALSVHDNADILEVLSKNILRTAPLISFIYCIIYFIFQVILPQNLAQIFKINDR